MSKTQRVLLQLSHQKRVYDQVKPLLFMEAIFGRTFFTKFTILLIISQISTMTMCAFDRQAKIAQRERESK